MFLDNLSVAILKLCDRRDYTYERASEKCALSSRHIGNIARRQTAPSIITLEKLCTGFDVTPNDLLLLSPRTAELSYRKPMLVTEFRRFQNRDGFSSYPVCPTCGLTVEREYQKFCDRCGQKLRWNRYLPYDE